MTAWERLLGEPTLRPLGSPCRICGNDPEQRHRVWDALTDRWQAGESLVEVAADYEVTPDDVAAVMVAQGEWLTAEARWWARAAPDGSARTRGPQDRPCGPVDQRPPRRRAGGGLMVTFAVTPFGAGR